MARGDADRITARLERVTEGAVTGLVLEITNDLIQLTPVDTGWAQSNWVPSIGSPVGEAVGSREGVDRSAQERGMAEVVAFTLDMGDIFISNNVPYIVPLNEGHSPKAQAGFIDMSIEWHVEEFNRKVFQ